MRKICIFDFGMNCTFKYVKCGPFTGGIFSQSCISVFILAGIHFTSVISDGDLAEILLFCLFCAAVR